MPLLGEVTCHRTVLAALADALARLEEAGRGDVIDLDGYQGCWNPRTIAGSAEVSRHAWGVAIDVNWDENPQGLTSVQDPVLVDALQRAGMTWGGTWLLPDAAHFEAGR